MSIVADVGSTLCDAFYAFICGAFRRGIKNDYAARGEEVSVGLH